MHSYFVIHIQFLGQSDIHSKVHKELQYTFQKWSKILSDCQITLERKKNTRLVMFMLIGSEN